MLLSLSTCVFCFFFMSNLLIRIFKHLIYLEIPFTLLIVLHKNMFDRFDLKYGNSSLWGFFFRLLWLKWMILFLFLYLYLVWVFTWQLNCDDRFEIQPSKWNQCVWAIKWLIHNIYVSFYQIQVNLHTFTNWRVCNFILFLFFFVFI